MSCPYSTLLGIPGQGIHALRVGGLAFNDTIMTIIAAVLTSYATGINVWLSMFLWFVVGEILHYGLGVDTAFLKMIGVKAICLGAPDTPSITLDKS
jgi:hypothetical protein